MLDKRYLEIIDYTGEGYQPCVDYGEWRVAILRFITDLKAENISFLECHKDTDEVFEVDGYKYVVDKEFLKEATPIKVDFTDVGFKVESNIKFDQSACGSCGSGGDCG